MRQFPPSRIVCLTEETVETLYLLGEQNRIVGVSGYAVRPPQVRREKPRVSAFTSADIPKILALEPDLVLTFSDLQASIAADLIRVGIAVHAFNHRDIAGILAMIRTLGALVGVADKSEELAQRYERRLGDVAAGSLRSRRAGGSPVWIISAFKLRMRRSCTTCMGGYTKLAVRSWNKARRIAATPDLRRRGLMIPQALHGRPS